MKVFFFNFRVVLRLGSSADFSHILLDLQEEVRPLSRKMDSCRGFKRTTVERILRKDGFALDWCAFRLVNDIHLFLYIIYLKDSYFFNPFL